MNATLLILLSVAAPRGLMVELLRDPAHAVITDRQPELGWIVDDDRRGAVQSAYQILVGSSPGAGDLWDSGRRRSRQSTGVSYGGKALEAEHAYWWKVRTWDGDGKVGPYSEPQLFRTGRFGDDGRGFPQESRWVRLDDGEMVLENRQRSNYHERKAQTVETRPDGPTFVDFGKAVFATLRFVAEAPADASVMVYLGERRTPDGVDRNPGKTKIGFAQQPVAVKKGTAEYTVVLPRLHAPMPHSQVLPDHMLEVTPFRYAEIAPGAKVTHVRQVALLYPFDDDASSFASSDDKLDQVWGLCKHTLKATPFLAMYADGNRERMPYEADAFIQQLGHYAVDREFAVARATNQFLIHNPSWPTEWQMHAVLMAHADYWHSGDVEHLRASYDDLRAKSLIALARPDGLISTRTGLVTPEFLRSLHDAKLPLRDIVDWPPGHADPDGKGKAFGSTTPQGERDGFVFSPINTVVNAFHYRSLVAMEEFARALGKKADAGFFGKRAALVRATFNDKLFDGARGIYRDGEGVDHASLHANMFPLAFGLVPDARKASVVSLVKERGMACSVYGSQFLLEALFDAGEAEAALKLMTSEDKRSWLNMIRVGSTMTTEAWDETFKQNLTWNHAWGSAPANIVARKLMGVEPLTPGFETVRIRPQPASLTSAAVKVPTIRGPVEVAWRRDGAAFELTVALPANTRAEVWLPGEALTEGGVPIARAPGVRVRKSVASVGGGRYRFGGTLRL